MIQQSAQRNKAIESRHCGMVHGVRPNFYEDTVASYGSDGFIYLYCKKQSTWEVVYSFKAHQSAIICLDWCHPKFGLHIVSGDFRGQIKIHKVTPQKKMVTLFTSNKLSAAVESVKWANNRFQILVGVANISFCVFWEENYEWAFAKYQETKQGSLAVVWSPDDNIVCGQKKNLKFLKISTQDRKIERCESLFNTKTLQIDGDIKRILWSPIQPIQFSQFIILTSNKLMFYQFENKQIKYVCQDNVSTIKNADIGWSNNYMKVHLYGFEAYSIKTKIYKLCLNGKWENDNFD